MVNGIYFVENFLIIFVFLIKDEISNDFYIEGVFDVCVEGRMLIFIYMMGNFFSFEEIVGLDEKYLVKRCGFGYRVGRILKFV